MKTKLHSLFIALALLAGIHQASAQGTTAFTYQGQLHDGGTNANGAYTMVFKLYDAVTSGNSLGTNTSSPTLVNGLFSVNLDFGNVFNGSARWLDITVTNGGVTQTLSPRVQVLPTPYAQFAAAASVATTGPNGVSLGGTNYIPNIQVFGSSGTFVVPAGVTKIQVVMWGGGGGGGGGNANASFTNDCTPGGGGGAGCYALNVFSVTNGSSYTVTVGAGGAGGSVGGGNGTSGSATSFGTLMTANGGGGGSGGPAMNNPIIFGAGQGGSGSTCTGAIAAFHGQDGQSGNYASGTGGNGASAWAAGLGGWGGNVTSSAESGEGPGAGGGGGVGISPYCQRMSGTASEVGPGADGSNGAVFVYY